MTALGVSLLLVGAIMILVEAHVPTMGVLGVPGVLALTAGAVLAVLGLGGGVLLGVVRSWDSASGCVQVDGALWTARRSMLDDDEESGELHAGDTVVVDWLEGLTVSVRRAEEWESIA